MLRRRVEDSVAAMFALQSAAPAFSLDEQIATGVFSPEIEAIRRPASGLDRREGALIEAAVRYALMNSTKYTCRALVPVEIYREAVEVIEANQGGDDVLSVRLPLSGAAAGRVVLDVLAVDRATGVVRLVEVKRSRAGVNDEQIRNLRGRNRYGPFASDPAGRAGHQGCAADDRLVGRSGLRLRNAG